MTKTRPPQALRFSYRRGERETRVTGDEPQGTMGRVLFLSSFARTFSSRERRPGTRQAKTDLSDLECNNVTSCCVRLYVAKSVNGFKLCATTRNNMQKDVQTGATCNIQQCWVLSANNVVNGCLGLKHTENVEK